MRIDGKTELYGILGWPVSHSLSPAMHNAAFAAMGMNRAYVPLPSTDVPAALAGLKALGLRGASVTIPHKQAVIPHLDRIDPVAAKIGAVNTLVIDHDGAITGYNTDWLGANRALAEAISLAGATVLLIGAGGSARAIGFGLIEAGARVILANRTVATAERLAADLGCQAISLAEADSVAAEALINATSVGMAPTLDACPLDPAGLSRFSAVMDIVYAPLATKLLTLSAAAGCRTVNGLAMLLYQGAAQFELWTGEKAPIEVMRAALS
jgi:shikimate dehydrogenase